MNVRIASSARARLKGLLGRESLDGMLLLAPCRDIHTVGMRHSIDVAFVAPDGTILESHRDVGPGRRLRNRRAAAVLERFACPQPWFQPGEQLWAVAPMPATRPTTPQLSGR